MREIGYDVAEQILHKFDEILALCGAKEEEKISTALGEFSSAIDSTLRNAEYMRDKSAEEQQEIVDDFKSKMINDIITVIGISLGRTLQATGQSMKRMAGEDEALKKAADEYFSGLSK